MRSQGCGSGGQVSGKTASSWSSDNVIHYQSYSSFWAKVSKQMQFSVTQLECIAFKSYTDNENKHPPDSLLQLYNLQLAWPALLLGLGSKIPTCFVAMKYPTASSTYCVYRALPSGATQTPVPHQHLAYHSIMSQYIKDRGLGSGNKQSCSFLHVHTQYSLGDYQFTTV